MRYFLLIINIDKIDVYILGIMIHFIYSKVFLTYIIYFHLTFHSGQKYFNILKNVFYIKNLAVK